SGRVALVEGRVRDLIAHRRRDDPNPEDPFRGLYLSDDAVDRLLRPAAPPPPLPSAERDRTERAGDEAERASQPPRLRQLARAAPAACGCRTGSPPTCSATTPATPPWPTCCAR